MHLDEDLSEAKAFFKEQKTRDPENDKCFECGTPGADWASVNHGIYVCLRCSGQHRSLGVQTSFVRSTSLDSWNRKYLDLMHYGGNSPCAVFFEHEGIKMLPIKSKYNTKAAQYYRDLLKAKAENKSPPAPLPAGTGQDFLPSFSQTVPMSTTGVSGQPSASGSSDAHNEPSSEAPWSGLTSIIGDEEDWQRLSSNVTSWWSSAKDYASQTMEGSNLSDWVTEKKKTVSENLEYAKTKVQADILEPGKQKAEEVQGKVTEISKSWWDQYWAEPNAPENENSQPPVSTTERIPDLFENGKEE